MYRELHPRASPLWQCARHRTRELREAGGFERAVLDFLVRNRALSQVLRTRMLGGRHRVFSVHNDVCVSAEDAEVRRRLASYMLRAPICLEKMLYNAVTATVIYRSKMHSGLKRNFQVMPGAQGLALLCKHIPDHYEHLLRYAGWYFNRTRGERARAARSGEGAASPKTSCEPPSEFATRAKAAWARLIRRVYKADPLQCPVCQEPMRVLALVEAPGVIRRILEHLGLWAPLAPERSPPLHAASGPWHVSLPLTYHPVPDIA